jgi:aminopeptidase C
MQAVPRHRQSPVTIRSDRAKTLLAQLTRSGKSQAKVIEDLLEDAVAREPTPKMTNEEFIAAINALVAPVLAIPNRPTFKELDDALWDENGLPI